MVAMAAMAAITRAMVAMEATTRASMEATTRVMEATTRASMEATTRGIHVLCVLVCVHERTSAIVYASIEACTKVCGNSFEFVLYACAV
jgi:hypothetical protein